MSIELPFANNTVATYAYEPFSYTISNPPPGTYTLTTTDTGGIPPGTLVNTGFEVVFSSPSNSMTPGLQSGFVITAKDGAIVAATSSNLVTVEPGRFLDGSGNSFVGRNVASFKNEPITPIPLVAPFAISVPTSVPTLPPGLTYVSNASNIYTITGTPLVTVPQSNYLVIGKATGSNLGKIISSRIGLSVSNERILLTLTGAPIVSPMTIGTPIAQRVFTAQYPPYPSGGSLRYTWSGLPDGISVTDAAGAVRTSPFVPSDSLSTLKVQGTPTVAAANAYRNAGITSNEVTFTATRTSPLPQLSSSRGITFGFGETVLFDTPPTVTLYSGRTVDPSAISFRAQTYFGSGSSITNIFSPDLRADLSINFVPAQGRGYLTSIPGGPTATGTASYTIKAINSFDISQTLLVPITVAADTVTFVSPTLVDACYNFVLSRPVSAPLSGYYPDTIQFRAVAASGNAVTFSAPSLVGTGVSLSTVDANTVQIAGTPEAVTALTTTSITANAVGTPATATTTVKVAILDDAITFSEPSPVELSFIQNRPITPIQLTATTLSERSVVSWTSTNMPGGLALSTTGRITGTHTGSTGSTFTVTASTGYASDSKTYTYTLTPDSIVLIQRPQSSYTLTTGGPIPPATISGLSYSGLVVSNFVFSNLPITYGLTLGTTTGVFGGTLTTSLPPDPLLPAVVSFGVQASAGLLTAGISATITTTSNIPKYQWYILKGFALGQTETTFDSWTRLARTNPDGPINPFTDYSIRPITVGTRSVVGVTNTTEVVRSVDGATFTTYDLSRTPWPFYDTPGAPVVSNDTTLNMGPNLITRVSNTTTLYGAGSDPIEQITSFWKSTNDGDSWSLTYPLLSSGFLGREWLSNSMGVPHGIATKDDVILISVNGYPSMTRSANGGSTWSSVSGDFATWTNEFCVDATRWVAAGSDGYSPDAVYGSASRTLRYSDTQGATWSLVTSGDFNYLGDFVVYGNGTWIAGGKHYDSGDGFIYFALRSSTDGVTWSTFTVPGTWYPVTLTFIDGMMRASYLESILFDGDSFVVVVTRNDDGTPYQSIFSHLADGSSLTTGWTGGDVPTLYALDGGGDTASVTSGGVVRRLKGRIAASLADPAPVLAFPAGVGVGPTVTSPTERSLLLYQYAAMTPITFSATGSAPIYFFLQDALLPRGLTFNSTTNTLSGTPMLLGTSTLAVYVKDTAGVTLFTLEIRVIIPTVVRQQTSAGAWTSLVRQYTEVNAAQNSVNGRALPATETTLGEFMSPQPPDVVNDTTCPKC